ncbi:MAG: FtsW/RodA/SpoVE family cell cycle protein, partial [Lachnospiraceae bacterium]|nr:FtsW/RodA/SpoVE family cell cycle protein [Lachnospiraceae bacterium]
LFLILKQPDLSTTIVTALIFLALLFIAGLSYKIILGLLAVSVPGVMIFFSLIMRPGQTILDDYQFKRIASWLHPEDYPDLAYQQLNSITAIGSGQLLGKGLNNTDVTSVKMGGFISEPQTDFIFAVAGEETGFIGSIAIIVLELLITLECILTARKAKDLAGKLICCGMAAFIGFQTFVNIGVTTGLMPNTGLPLPFVSYGLTSLVTLFIGLGFVLNVSLQQVKNSNRVVQEKGDFVYEGPKRR